MSETQTRDMLAARYLVKRFPQKFKLIYDRQPFTGRRMLVLLEKKKTSKPWCNEKYGVRMFGIVLGWEKIWGYVFDEDGP